MENKQKPRNKKKEVTIKGIVIAVLLVALVLWYFNQLNNRSSIKRGTSQQTEIEALMGYDMNQEYPKTPRDVAKLHNRYFKVLYGQKLTDEELDTMNGKIRSLYCMELLQANPEADSLDNLKKDIEAVKEQKYTYKMCELPEASQVEYFTRNGREMASLEVCITLNTGDKLGYFYRQYAMIKENDKWKIYGWTESQLPRGSATTQAGTVE